MVDCERALDQFKPYSIFLAGVLFGAGWWVWGDAIAVSAVAGEPFQPLFLTPGLVATLAILVMNCAPRSELASDMYGDDATLCRSRLTLFISYVFSVAAISIAVFTLLNLKAQEHEDLWIGAAGIVQACLVVASGLVTWFFRDSQDNENFIY